MALFEYKGIQDGRTVKGTVESDSSKNARLKLKQQKQIFVTEIVEKKEQFSKGKFRSASTSSFREARVKLSSLTMMNRQLATLIQARIPLDEALSALVDQTEDPKLKFVLSQIKEQVNEGKSLAESCKLFPKVFSPIFISMIRVGEAGGNLDVVLKRLAKFSENQYELRNKIAGAMAYPIVMMIVGFGIIVFLFAFAIPKITEVFEGSNKALPSLTVFMIEISKFMSHDWFFVVSFVVGTFFFLRFYLGTEKGRAWWDAVSLKIPLFGKLKRMIAVSRFARTLSTMIGSGVQLLDAIDIVKDVVDNKVIRDALIESRNSISEGHTISGPLKASGQFPPILIHMIAVGEKTGELEEMLNVVSDTYDQQVDTAINSMTRLLEPLMIVVMGGIIALVALSIFLPMLQLNNSVG